MTEVKGQCPAHQGETRGSDSYSFNTDKKQGKCLSCGLKTWEHEGVLYGKHENSRKGFKINEGEAVRGAVEDDNEDDGLGEDFTPKAITEASYEPWRGIVEETFRKFDVVSSEDRVVFRYPSGGTKTRLKDKKEFFAKNLKSDELFGMNLFPSGCSKKVTITEGEGDTLSAWQMLQSGRYLNPVVSLPSATPSGKLWEKCRGWLDSFDQIILSLDNDDPGRKVAVKISLMFPGKVKVMDHGAHKDANDFLMNGEAQAYKNAWWAAKPYKPDDMLVDAEDYLDLYDESPDFEYFETGIPELDEKILGINKGYFTVIQAPTGCGKCLHPDQGVLMWDGSTKAAKDVVVGDKLMGDDSSPRNVLSTTTGEQEMFKVIPNKGETWVCNISHILSVVNTTTGAKFDISIEDYLKQSETFKHLHKLYRASVESFGYFQDHYERYNPYLVGAYLGDGHKHRSALTLGPKKKGVMDYVIKCLEVTGNKTSLEDKGSCTEVTFKGGGFFKYIQPYMADKSIPDEYKKSGWHNRMSLLAGLLDTDGWVRKGGAGIVQKSETLARDILFVARSLGFAAYIKRKVGRIKSSGFEGEYWNVSIFGDLSNVPFRRLVTPPRRINKDPLRVGFTLEPLGVGSYAGFQIDGNRRFLLDDFTVTHNTEVMRYLEYQCLTKSKYKFAFMHLEESKLRSVLGLVSYDLGDNLTLKKFIDAKGREDDVKVSIERLTEEERMMQFSFRPEDGYEDLLDKIKFLKAAFDIDFVFFEPIQDLVHGEDKEGKLADLSSRLGTMATDLDVGIITIAHQNQNGDTMYATMIGKKAAFEILLQRDQEAEDHEERNRTYVRVGRKNRVGLGNGPAGALDFDHESFTLVPVMPPTAPTTPNHEGSF